MEVLVPLPPFETGRVKKAECGEELMAAVWSLSQFGIAKIVGVGNFRSAKKLLGEFAEIEDFENPINLEVIHMFRAKGRITFEATLRSPNPESFRYSVTIKT